MWTPTHKDDILAEMDEERAKSIQRKRASKKTEDDITTLDSVLKPTVIEWEKGTRGSCASQPQLMGDERNKILDKYSAYTPASLKLLVSNSLSPSEASSFSGASEGGSLQPEFYFNAVIKADSDGKAQKLIQQLTKPEEKYNAIGTVRKEIDEINEQKGFGTKERTIVSEIEYRQPSDQTKMRIAAYCSGRQTAFRNLEVNKINNILFVRALVERKVLRYTQKKEKRYSYNWQICIETHALDETPIFIEFKKKSDEILLDTSNEFSEIKKSQQIVPSLQYGFDIIQGLVERQAVLESQLRMSITEVHRQIEELFKTRGVQGDVASLTSCYFTAGFDEKGKFDKDKVAQCISDQIAKAATLNKIKEIQQKRVENRLESTTDTEGDWIHDIPVKQLDLGQSSLELIRDATTGVITVRVVNVPV